MITCPTCGAQAPDQSAFCESCGTRLNGAGNAGGAPEPYIPWYNHTGEFTTKDISDNKVMAMLPYLFGIVGIIVTLLASGESPYAYFHVRQAIKFLVVKTLLTICNLFLFWTIIVPLVWLISKGIIFVLKIIAFLQVCMGEAKEPAIIRSLGFLN